jgi:hypothetical protein
MFTVAICAWMLTVAFGPISPPMLHFENFEQNARPSLLVEDYRVPCGDYEEIADVEAWPGSGQAVAGNMPVKAFVSCHTSAEARLYTDAAIDAVIAVGSAVDGAIAIDIAIDGAAANWPEE